MEKRLGKGLEALISEDISKVNEKVASVRINEITPNPNQPRSRFVMKKMEELISSIKEKGVIQPLLVRPADKGYEIIAGERRYRAAKELSLDEVPVIIRTDVDDANSLELALIENIQREELNPIEEARAYQELAGKFEYTLKKIGQMVGKDKTTVSNSLRLLGLPREIRTFLEEEQISTGHAKVLLSVTGDSIRKRLARKVIKKGLSVRETEQLVSKVSGATKKHRMDKDPEIMSLEEALQYKLGTKVAIHQGKKRGRLEIQYFSNEDLQRIIRLVLS